MKTAPFPQFINPTVLLLAALGLALAAVTLSGTTIALLSNLKLNLVILLLTGMAICASGGIGRVASVGQWTHPLSILGYLLGILILAGALAIFLGWDLPVIQNDRQAFLLITGFVAAKFVLTGIHEMVNRKYPYTK